MTKIVLPHLDSIQNDPTAVDTINDNFDKIVTAMENTLSRDGTSPNEMSAQLDMNSNRIINLPRPLNDLEAVRLKDIKNLYGPPGPPGPEGPMGPQGEKGDTGATGATGAQGPKGDTGSQGPKGDQGIQGPQGDKGDQGDQGIQGPPGADGQVLSVVGGTDITVDSTDPANPIVNYTGTPGGVISFNTRTGAVVSATNDYNFNQLAGNISVNQMNSGTSASSSTYWRGDGTWSSPAGGVTSFNTRTGAVVPASGDYSYSQISGRPTIREVLTANRTYYVSTTGSDSNNGLSSGTPFLTIQKAIDVCTGTLDFYGFTVTIQLADGTYATNNIIGPGVGITGVGKFLIQGNTTTPANVVVSPSTGVAFQGSAGGVAQIQYMTISGSTSTGTGIQSSDGSYLAISNVIFGACYRHLVTTVGGRIVALGPYTISGGGFDHVLVGSGIIRTSIQTLTLVGTPAFSGVFARIQRGGLFDSFSMTYVGSATGSRFDVSGGGTIWTQGGGTSYLPGNAAGTGATTTGGGFYA